MANIQPSGYYYSYTYAYRWVARPENFLASAKIGEQTSLLLSEHKLHVSHKRKTYQYDLAYLTNVEIAFKRLIGPLVVGGITTPLAILALSNYLINLWPGLAIATIGAFLLFYGYKGSYTLKISAEKSQVAFFIDILRPGGNEFLKQVNQAILHNKQPKVSG